LLEIEDRSVKEIAQLTGWSVPLVKVRAFRARARNAKDSVQDGQGQVSVTQLRMTPSKKPGFV